MSKYPINPEYENSHYDYPIPSREAIRSVLTDEPQSIEAIVKNLDADVWALEAVLKRLEAMKRDQQVEKSEQGFLLSGKSRVVETEVLSSKSGDLSVCIDGVYILLSYRHSQGLFPHDKILVRIPDPVNSNSKAVPVKVLHSSARQIVCLVSSQRGKKRLAPFDRRIKHILEVKSFDDLAENDVILVSRKESQSNRRVLKVELTKRLGKISDPHIEREIARSLFHLAKDWGEVDIKQSQEEIDAQLKHREDWTHLPLVTIDGEDAKDFDDAVYAEKTKSGYELYVAIADVSYYVQPGSMLDEQARIRGNSIYLPGFVIPMLPKQLSNHLCSLMPDVNRLAVGVKISLNAQGDVVNIQPSRVVIKSHARLTYQQAEEMLLSKSFPKQLEKGLIALDEVAKKLQAKRIEKGAIMFSSEELVFSFSGSGHVDEVGSKTRGWSHQLIEECMLCANCSVGAYLTERGRAFITRVHHPPNADKIAALSEYLASMDIALNADPSPKDLQNALNEVPDIRRAEAESMMLRSMSQAIYSDTEVSHYALSADSYTHFTSPIRRYVDLIVHRALLEEAGSDIGLEQCAKNCSLTERCADEASWFAQAWLKTSYMKGHIDQVYMGKVNTVTHFGIFVKLDDAPVEGLVHISLLGDDHFTFDQATLSLVGRATKERFIQGKRVRVRIKSADLLTQQIDFTLVKKR
jgi:ribonuclease R